jgi:asparaginyl-tRNA synthetase
MDSPIFTPNACEGTTTLPETQYFDQHAYLTQSGQLYQEATAMAFGRTYCFGPAFRAEKSKTRRHLIEFWMMEPEWAFATLEDVMGLMERLVCFTVGRVLEEHAADLATIERDPALLQRLSRRSHACTTTRRWSACARPDSHSNGGATSAARTKRCCREVQPAGSSRTIPRR